MARACPISIVLVTVWALPLCGCPGDGDAGEPPMAAPATVVPAAQSAVGADFPPPPVHPAGPHTATGRNPFLPPPAAEPTTPPLAPEPAPAPLVPPATAPSDDPGGTPL